MVEVLVTGGHGFIGSKLVASLRRQGHSVTILDSLVRTVHGDELKVPELDGSVRFVRGSLEDKDALKVAFSEKPEIVFHLASETGTGESMYSAKKYYRSNVLGTLNLYEYIVESNQAVRKVVLSSSRSIYGEGQYACASSGIVTTPRANGSLFNEPALCPQSGSVMEPIPTKENAQLDPRSLYASTKAEQENLTRIYSEIANFSYSILRLQNVYGAGQSLKNPYTGILAIFSSRLRNQLPIELFEMGEASRDFVHVNDVVDIMSKVAASIDCETFNVGTGVPTTVKEVAEEIASFYKVPPSLIVRTQKYRVGDVFNVSADMSKYYDAHGKRDFIRFSEGLKEFLTWAETQDAPEIKYDESLEQLKDKGLLK